MRDERKIGVGYEISVKNPQEPPNLVGIDYHVDELSKVEQLSAVMSFAAEHQLRKLGVVGGKLFKKIHLK